MPNVDIPTVVPTVFQITVEVYKNEKYYLRAKDAISVKEYQYVLYISMFLSMNPGGRLIT